MIMSWSPLTNYRKLKNWHRDVKKIFRSAQMNIGEFIFDAEEVHSKVAQNEKLLPEVVTVLGIPWKLKGKLTKFPKGPLCN